MTTDIGHRLAVVRLTREIRFNKSVGPVCAGYTHRKSVYNQLYVSRYTLVYGVKLTNCMCQIHTGLWCQVNQLYVSDTHWFMVSS